MKLLNKIKPIKFEWDKFNKEKNWKNHQVDFRECEEIFFNEPLKIFKDIKHSQEEDRFIALGISNRNKKLFIVFTIRNIKIRVISARNQNSKEKGIYEKK